MLFPKQPVKGRLDCCIRSHRTDVGGRDRERQQPDGGGVLLNILENIMRLIRSRVHYWSHGWFAKMTAKWIGAPARPSFATMKEWREFDLNQKNNFYAQEIIEDTLDALQNFFLFPSDVWYTIRCYVRNRFVDKLHVLQTGLNPGQYYDYEDRLLHGMFNSFVQFIEEDLTLETLKWELTLTQDFEWLPEEEAKQHPDYGKPSSQADKAREQLELYTWWKEIRPKRIDPCEASGYKAWSDSNTKKEDTFWAAFADDETESRADIRKKLADKWREIERQYEQEDEEMMIRLVRIRRSCWT